MSSREPLRHHGDVEAEPGLLDFAVNVRAAGPPEWLRQRLVSALDRLGRYPGAADERAACEAIAARHGRSPSEVLPLAGAAECFALLPSLRPALAAVVHPSFTEPELALRTAGVPVVRVPLSHADGFQFEPGAVPPEADLVVLGNPTNPTSVLHRAEAIRELIRPGRVVVVDEAFADAVPGEPESLAAHSGPGLLVVRSLTKTWSIPGLRVGYALGAPELLERLVERRPHWPVSALALEALIACQRPAALGEAAEAARATVRYREALADELDALPGLAVLRPASAPFLLLRVSGGMRVRDALRRRGIAVRRGDTFPGLSADYLRVAVRSPEENAVLVRALREVCSTTMSGV